MTSTYGCSVWKSIRYLWNDFWVNVVILVGDGSKTAFWEDHWIGDSSLKSTSSDLYSISSQTRNQINKFGIKGGTVTLGEL